MTIRDMIWDAVYSLIDERHQDRLPLYEGVKKYEDEVADIKDKVEELASNIEEKIIKDLEDQENQEPDAHCPERGHNMV